MNNPANNLIARVPLIGLPRSGQTTVFRAGDDGHFRAGSPIAGRFLDTGAGTVIDRVTGLEWVKQPELILPGASDLIQTNQIENARGDWICDGQYAAGDLVRDPLTGKFYVCASAVLLAADAAVVVTQGDTWNGTYLLGEAYYGGQPYYQAPGAAKFIYYVPAESAWYIGNELGNDEGSTRGTLTGTYSGGEVVAYATLAEILAVAPTHWRETVWTASAGNLTTPAAMNWNAAIDNCLALEYAGHDDWRLPNWMELVSLVDVSLGTSSAPYINTTVFPNAQNSAHWTSSAVNYYALRVRCFFQAYPGVGAADPATVHYVRPVRGGYVNG